MLELVRNSIKYGRLFLFDLDDTLVANSGYSMNHASLDWIPGARKALQELTLHPINIAIVTNQASISKKIFTDLEVLQGLEEFLVDSSLLGIRIDAIYVCPHQDSDFCTCRKPKPGLVEKALIDFEVDAVDVRLFGNSQRDVLAGAASGVRSFLISPTDLYEKVFGEV